MKNNSSRAASERCRLCAQSSDKLGQGTLLSLSYPSDYSIPPEPAPCDLFPSPARVFFRSWDCPDESDRNCLPIQTRNYTQAQPLKVSDGCELQLPLNPGQIERFAMKREDESIEDNSRDHLQAHYQCAVWSSGGSQVIGESEGTWNQKFLSALSTATQQQCKFCHLNGASIQCSGPDCSSYYHFPCALMEGNSMDFKNFQLFCPKHSNLSKAYCLQCKEKGCADSSLIFCCKCGRSWHPKCISINDTTYLRAGWTCEACKVCQKCDDREDISQLLICSSCDRAIHLGCAGLVAMPSTEWRCEDCRSCVDCGSNSAGNGPSCRWHGGYTVCSRCNQLRCKGSFCFICQGAYKQVTDIPMIQCDYCQKWIHAKCDKINRQTYDMLGRPKSRYFCPECRDTKGVNIFLAPEEEKQSSITIPLEHLAPTTSIVLDDDLTEGKTVLDEILVVPDPSLMLGGGTELVAEIAGDGVVESLLDVGSEQNVYMDEVDENNLDKLDKSIDLQTQEDYEAEMNLHGEISLFSKDSASKRLKKREILESYTPGVSISKEKRPLSSSGLNLRRITMKNKKKKNRLRNLLTSQLGLPKGVLNNRFRNHFKEGRRKYYRDKELNGKSGIDIDHIPPFLPLIFPYVSRFLLYQKELCACCGAAGQGKDGSLLICAQCANCYHDYCLKTKVPSSRLRHGWRCPKCASCEACGLATDEACLLMCDQCDILYHTYCLKPPLRSVPKGSWKCSWCVKCTQCASDSPGINGSWQKDFTLCAPCGSRSTCHICSVNYQDGDLIMKCSLCKRWNHGSCDGFNSKSDIQKMVQKKYYCSLCRPLIREKGLKNLLPYKQLLGHKKEVSPFKRFKKVKRGEFLLDTNPSSQTSSFIDTGPADLSSSLDQNVIEDMLLSSMNRRYKSGLTLEHNPTATIIQHPRNILKSMTPPRDRKPKVLVGPITKKKSLKAMREESRKQKKHERRLKAKHTMTEEDDRELDSFDKNILPHLTRYQKACLRWVMDEERGTLATKAPVLYANMSFTDLKDKYPGWMDRARAVNNLWKKLPMTERQDYIDKAKLNREKLESEGVYQKRNPPRIIKLYAVKAFKLNQMTDQPQGLKRDFSTRRPRRTVAELQKAREEEEKVKKELGLEDTKPRKKGRRIINGKRCGSLSGKGRSGMHTPHTSFSFHGDLPHDIMFCPDDEKSPLQDQFPFTHQPFQPLLHGTKGSVEHKPTQLSASSLPHSDSSLNKLPLPGSLPYGPASTSPNAKSQEHQLVSSKCIASSEPFNLSRPSSLELPQLAQTSNSLECPETKPFKSSPGVHPQTSNVSSRHILHPGYTPQQGYKSGAYPHSAPVQSYPQSPFNNLPIAANSSMHCYPPNPQAYNYQHMSPGAPYQSHVPYYYQNQLDPKYRAYSEQKPFMQPAHSPQLAHASRTASSVHVDTPMPDKSDLRLEFPQIPPNSHETSVLPASAPPIAAAAGEQTPCSNGFSSEETLSQERGEPPESSTLHAPMLPEASQECPDNADVLPLPPLSVSNPLTKERNASQGKPPVPPLQSKYKPDLPSPYHTHKYPSPWGAYPDGLAAGDKFKKPMTPSEMASIRSSGGRKKSSTALPPEFPAYPCAYAPQESLPLGYQSPYFHAPDSPYPPPPGSPFNVQMMNQYPHDPSNRSKFKSNRRYSNPPEYSPSFPGHSTSSQFSRQALTSSSFVSTPLPQSALSDSSPRHASPSLLPFPPPSQPTQSSPFSTSPISSKAQLQTQKASQKFNSVVLPSPSLERATSAHCVKTRESPQLIQHLEKIVNSCNKRELSYFDCLELTNMTASHTRMIDTLSADTKTRYTLYEELNSILEVRRSSILRRYSGKQVRLKKQYLTKVLVEPVVPLETLIPALNFLWGSSDKLSSAVPDFYSSYSSFSPPSTATPTVPSAVTSSPETTDPATSRDNTFSELLSSVIEDKSGSVEDQLSSELAPGPDATSTPLNVHASLSSSSNLPTLPTSSGSMEDPLPLLPTDSGLRNETSLSDLNLSDCSFIQSDPESTSNTPADLDRKRHLSPDPHRNPDSACSKKSRSSPVASDHSSSLSLMQEMELAVGVSGSASFSDQFQSLVQDFYDDSNFTLEKASVSGIEIPLSLDQAIKEEIDSDKQNSEQPNTALLFKKKPRQTRATKWAVWSPDFYKAFLKSAASRKCRRHKLMQQQLSTRSVPPPDPDDERTCALCGERGDRDSKQQGRLVATNVGEWVHVGCALWSDGATCSKDGKLENVNHIMEKSQNNICCHCNKKQASVICFGCNKYFHLPCASAAGCHFYSDKSVECAEHFSSSDGEVSSFFTSEYYFVQYCNAAMLDSVSASEGKLMLRLGNVIFLKIGQLCPKVRGTYSQSFIYPVGYVCSRFYWSVNDPFQLSQYWCSITLEDSQPLFSVYTIDRTQEPPRKLCIADKSIIVVWDKILEPIQSLRVIHGQISINSKAMRPEDFFGLSEPTIIQMIESLPGIEQMIGYKCKYSVRKPTQPLPIPYNPSGAARTEIVPKAPQYRRHLIHQVATPTETVSTPVATPLSQGKELSKEAVATPIHVTPALSKNAQYRKLRSEWKSNVRLAKSNIQGLGLYARRDIDKDQMVIEYIGEMIKNELADVREQIYNRQNRGCYMFRVDNLNVVDATRKGGFARYINHSCEPNCSAEIVNIEGRKKIIIISQRKIQNGEELTYDYKFEFEDTAYKIPCLCGSSCCRKWMN